jgi:hypothetical protein
MLRLFKLAKGSAIKSRTQAINHLKSVLISADSALVTPRQPFDTASWNPEADEWAADMRRA